MKLEDLRKAIDCYKKYIEMNKKQVIIFKKAVADFELNVDFPMFGLLEEDIESIKKKLDAFIERPKDFCMEFNLEHFRY